ALVVGDIERPARALPDSVRRAQAARHVFNRTVARYADDAAAVRWLVRCTRAPRQDRGPQRRVETAVEILEAESELVEVRGHRPVVAHGGVTIGEAVAVVVDELRELLLLQHVDLAVDDPEPERLRETVRHALQPDLVPVRRVDVREYVDAAFR